MQQSYLAVIAQNKFLFAIVAIFAVAGFILIVNNTLNSIPNWKYSPQQILIHDSGSTNTRGWQILVNSNGSGVVSINGGYDFKGYSYVVGNGTFPSQRFYYVLGQVGNITGIPHHSCIKPVSFAENITVTFNNQTTGDITCISINDTVPDQALQNMVYNLMLQTNVSGTR